MFEGMIISVRVTNSRNMKRMYYRNMNRGDNIGNKMNSNRYSYENIVRKLMDTLHRVNVLVR